MSLFVVSTPIGHPDDITIRAINLLNRAPIIIGEERKVVSKLLNKLELKGKTIELLNEHSSSEDIEELTKLCIDNDVCLVTDCGTPAFCDPGAMLVASCRENSVSVSVAPGASSLMAFLSLLGKRLDKFLFEGFLPANKEERRQRLMELKSESLPIVLMDTPYRLMKLLNELSDNFPKNFVSLGVSLTQEGQNFLVGTAQEILKQIEKEGEPRKAEFVLLLEPLRNKQSAKPKLKGKDKAWMKTKRKKRATHKMTRQKKRASGKF